MAVQANATNILIVDDEPEGRSLERLLAGNGYECTLASDAEEARKLLGTHEFSAVLSDMSTPGSPGLDLLMYVRNAMPDAATVVLTGKDDPNLVASALEMGVYGYIPKPYQPSEVLVHVANALRRRALELENRHQRERLEQMVRQRTEELWDVVSRLEEAESELRYSQEETVNRLSLAAEFRDDESANHNQRMSRYCALIARAAGETEEWSDLLRVASVMHDLGKIGIPDQIVNKSGPLTPQERDVMKEHCRIGYRILTGSSSALLNLAASVALTHHERFNGSGYPRGLSDEELPLESRIAAIADTFDALTTDRPYREGLPVERAVEVLQEDRGELFDPELLDVFLRSVDQASVIREQFPEL